MTHATDGILLAYVDGEIDGPAAAELDGHLAACAECARELAQLRRLSATTHEALGMLAAPPPMIRAQAALAAERARLERSSPVLSLSRLGARGLARAAMLLLALAGAAAAAVPGSPVRRALETTIARVTQILNGEAEAPAVPAPIEPAVDVPAPAERASMAIAPADGRVRVVLHAPAGAVDVTVRLVEARRAVVETASPHADVRLRSAAGRIEVIGLSTGAVTIDVPAAVPNATIEVGGLVYVYKEGRALQLTGPAGNDRGGEVRFRIGS